MAGLPRAAGAPLSTSLVPESRSAGLDAVVAGRMGLWQLSCWERGTSLLGRRHNYPTSFHHCRSTSPDLLPSAQICSHPWCIHLFWSIICHAKAPPPTSCSSPSSLFQQYAILQVVLRNLVLIQVKLFCIVTSWDLRLPWVLQGLLHSGKADAI